MNPHALVVGDADNDGVLAFVIVVKVIAFPV